ncbi:carboxymethylenebutenolidase [Streptomyces sp. PT12]|nr:carboxymethylenebutenolidase [Streptomyces sp. PT12]
MPTLSTQRIAYELGGDACEGVLVADAGGAGAAGGAGVLGERPLVLVFHGLDGLDDAQVAFAETLAGWGYPAFAVDLFGTEVTQAGPERRGERMAAFMADRGALRRRLFDVVAMATAGPGLPGVDRGRVAAVGFCFGGLCVLDLARAGAELRAVAAFHGVLTPPGDMPERRPGPAGPRVLVLHGWDDPFAPPADVTALGRELTERGLDWQIHAHGHTLHAFTTPTANDPEGGVGYHEVSARRATASLRSFLAEVLV